MKTRIQGHFAAVPALVAILLSACGFARASEPLSLAGDWRFELDRDDAGVRARWFDRELTQRIRLPGSLSAQGVGDEVTADTSWIGGIVDRSWFTASEYAKYRQPGSVKVPFWLQPDKYYAGVAWFQRDLEIPRAWQDRRVVLMLERPHWETRVWVDDRMVGSNHSLSTPHEYEVGRLTPGQHRLTLRIDNRMVVDVGRDSHSVSDHTQGNWNGVVGRMELRSGPLVWIEDLQVYPDLGTKSVTVTGRIGNLSGVPGQGSLRLRGAPLDGPMSARQAMVSVAWSAHGGTFQAGLNLGDGARSWDEFNPNLYRLSATMDQPPATRSVTFGLREISTQGTQFLINGRKTFFRGTLDCCIFPKTGHPPMEVTEWKRIIGVAKAHGLNLIRFHSWCPPEAAFVAADELGFYFHVEAASWANSSTTLGDGKPVDPWIYDETDRILKAYGNHPSFVFLLQGNEPGGRQHAAYLAKWVNHYKARDSRRLYSSAAGWPQLPENQFHVTPDPRLQAWGAGLKSRINAQAPETRTDYNAYIRARSVPVISHEIGQWCVYPSFDEIKKYTGYLKPKNFEIFRDTLQARHLGDQAKEFLFASGKLQTLCYKEDIEAALRTPGMGGFELLDLHDFPGQGTALVGVLDPFWEGKGYVTAKEYRRFCNRTVPLARLSKRVFTTGESLIADLEVAHFGPAPLAHAVTVWQLVNDAGRPVARGRQPAQTLPVDNGIRLGSVNICLQNVPAPARYRLVVGLAGTKFENDWDVWVYPANVASPTPPGITMASELNEPMIAALNAGGKVLLAIPPRRVKNAGTNQVALGFSSIFWNTAWTGRQPPTTLGILCHPKHPLFAEFPTDRYSNWQWWYLVTQAGAMILDDLPTRLQPTVQVIDDWVTAHRLGLVFEARVGPGKLLVCSIDLQRELDANPVVPQFRRSLLNYMAGDRFKPSVAITAEQVRSLMVP